MNAKRTRGSGAGHKLKRHATTQLALRLPNEALKAVDEIVASRPLEGVDRSTVLRELIAEGLKARGKGQQR